VSDELKIEVIYLNEVEMKPVAFPAAATSTIVTLITMSFNIAYLYYKS
jgi:hypothetical protein